MTELILTIIQISFEIVIIYFLIIISKEQKETKKKIKDLEIESDEHTNGLYEMFFYECIRNED